MWFLYACAWIAIEAVTSLVRLILDFENGRLGVLLLVHTIAIWGAVIGMIGLSTTEAFKKNVLGREAK